MNVVNKQLLLGSLLQPQPRRRGYALVMGRVLECPWLQERGWGTGFPPSQDTVPPEKAADTAGEEVGMGRKGSAPWGLSRFVQG